MANFATRSQTIRRFATAATQPKVSPHLAHKNKQSATSDSVPFYKNIFPPTLKGEVKGPPATAASIVSHF